MNQLLFFFEMDLRLRELKRPYIQLSIDQLKWKQKTRKRSPGQTFARYLCCPRCFCYFCISYSFFKKSFHTMSFRDSVSRPIAPDSSVACGDDTVRVRRQCTFNCYSILPQYSTYFLCRVTRLGNFSPFWLGGCFIWAVFGRLQE
jgi:hypothetical protein